MKEEDIWTKTMRRYLNYRKSCMLLWSDCDDRMNELIIKNAKSNLKNMFGNNMFEFGNARVNINSLEELIIRLDLLGY